MPTYEYECLECKHRFDVFQSINDDAINKCEKCSSRVRKVFGKAGIIFKGSGFYVNDYKKKDVNSSKENTCNASNKSSESAETRSSSSAN